MTVALFGFLALALAALVIEHVSDPGRLPTPRDPDGWAGRHLATERGALASVLGGCAWAAVLICAALTAWLGTGSDPVRVLAAVLVPASLVGAWLGVAHALAAVSSVRACQGATVRARYVVALERRDMMIVDMEGASDDQHRGDRRGQITGPDA